MPLDIMIYFIKAKISCGYIWRYQDQSSRVHVYFLYIDTKQGPRDGHQDNQLPKFKLGPGTWLAIARSPQEIEDYITT